MKHRDDFQELWRDTLDEGLPRDFAGESLARMLGSARSRRRRKIAARAGLGTALVLLLLAFLFTRQTPPATTSPEVVEAVPVPRPPAAPPPAAPRVTVVETIDDEELLAAFAGRPVLLVGSGESKQIVLLDQKKK